MSFSHLRLVITASLISAACAQAQVPPTPQPKAPDAGSILQGIDRDRKPNAPASTTPKLPMPEATPKSSSAAKVIVREFAIVGNTLIDEASLLEVLHSYKDRELTMAELQQAADTLVQFYLEKGYMARTILPKQDVTEGTVRIQVLESNFSGVQIDPSIKDKRIGEAQIRQMIEAQLKAGEPLSLKKLERGLMLADDIPGVNVTGRLVTGTANLTTGVFIKVTDEPIIYGEAAVDNFGSRSTGPVRLTLNGTMSGAYKMGDQFSLFTMKTEGIDFARASFSLPNGYDGWRVGTNASVMRYKVVEGIAGQGSSVVLGLDSNYPILRSRNDNLYFVNNFDRKFFDNLNSLGTTTTHYQSWVWSSGLNGSTTDRFLPGGLTSGNLMFSYGHINLNGSPNQADDWVTVKAQGNFQKLKYTGTHTQNISADLVGFVSVSGQLANKNLDSSEKFYSGGPLGVRAYPNNEGGGSEGQLMNLELRQNLPNDFVLTAFYDRGRVLVNKSNDFAGAADPNTMTYKGRGLQLAWFGPNNINLKAIWARRVGNNPYPTAQGTDQDGTQKIDRYWLSASFPF